MLPVLATTGRCFNSTAASVPAFARPGQVLNLCLGPSLWSGRRKLDSKLTVPLLLQFREVFPMLSLSAVLGIQALPQRPLPQQGGRMLWDRSSERPGAQQGSHCRKYREQMHQPITRTSSLGAEAGKSKPKGDPGAKERLGHFNACRTWMHKPQSLEQTSHASKEHLD